MSGTNGLQTTMEYLRRRAVLPTLRQFRHGSHTPQRDNQLDYTFLQLGIRFTCEAT
jgi:hypothetical protein